MNAPIQGSAADIIKLAMIAVQKALDDQKLRTKMLLQVHDELVFELPEAEADVIGRALAARMCQVAELDIPLVVELGMGPNWDSSHEGTVTISS